MVVYHNVTADGKEIIVTESLPTTAVIRVSRGSFDPGRLAEVEAMNASVSEYLVPAIRRLPGFIHFYAGVSAEGSVVNVSIWDSDEHASQLDHLTEMTVTARGEAEAAGVAFTAIVNYPIGWSM
jgi:heme-degrading monooxygenase HmoA